jgi:iron complex outermembrane receptor protein
MKQKNIMLNPLTRQMRMAFTGSMLLLAGANFSAMAAQADTSKAAEEKEQDVEKIVVVGSRGAPRSVGDSTVPVDVIGADEFTKNGPSDMLTLMSAAVPSFNVNSQPINDAATLVRPANLRGLPPDSTLVLVNGKRRHRSAVIIFLGSGLADGSQGPDLSVIPSIALKQVEILRDGAAAQYGSDAIAGVINFRLKDNAEGGSVEVKYGSHYEGDGDLRQVAANIGLPFTDNGFANISTEFKQSDVTSRTVQRKDAADLTAKGNNFILNPAQTWGSPEFKRDFKIFGNLGVEVAKNTEFYSFGNFAERDVEGGFYYRNPQTRDGVYTGDEGKTMLIGSLDKTKAACPTITFGDKNFAQINAEVKALPSHCFAFFNSIPGGFTPRFGGIVTDAALAGGIKGEMDNGWSYDMSATYGRSEVEFYLRNTLNPSMGPNSPRAFKPGAYVQQEQGLNYDMNKLIEVDALPYPLAVAGGLEYRIDTFEVKAGDKNSFEVGPLAEYGFGIGSNGFQGFKPDTAGSFNRYNYAAYTEVGAEFSDHFRSDFALRYENYEDFGNTTNAKLTGRYQLTDELAFRSAISTGFRAPTIGQTMVQNVTTAFSQGGLVDTATLPPTHPISLLKGAKQLTPEESKNFSFGAVAEIDDLFITLDYFRIKVTDRISQTSNITLTPSDIQKLLDLGVRDATNYAFVKYFTNDFDTTTQGIDFVTNYAMNLGGGRTTFALAANWTDTTVDAYTPGNISTFKIRQLEDGLPGVRGSFTVSHNLGDISGFLRLNYYGGYFEDHLDSELPANFGAETTLDTEVSYVINDSYTISVGANNLLDAVPENNPWSHIAGARYPTTAIMGFNGGFYYARMTYNF